MNPKEFPYPICLGSGSPRRKALLSEMGFSFRVFTLPTKEDYPKGLFPHEIAEHLALKKSIPIRECLIKNEVLITSDTVVALDNQLLEKAPTAHEAFQMLERLSGFTHRVISGLCVYHEGKEYLTHSETEVTFKSLTEAEINYYIETYQPFDKAGAYGIQEWIGQIGVTRINGSFYNVVGLPTEELWAILTKISQR